MFNHPSQWCSSEIIIFNKIKKANQNSFRIFWLLSKNYRKSMILSFNYRLTLFKIIQFNISYGKFDWRHFPTSKSPWKSNQGLKKKSHSCWQQKKQGINLFPPSAIIDVVTRHLSIKLSGNHTKTNNHQRCIWWVRWIPIQITYFCGWDAKQQKP